MKKARFRHLYGPVPSRRLGRSLGIDLVPFKTCTYDCVYCQLGRTTAKTLEREEYVAIEEVLVELEQKLNSGDIPDYISLAGSGEPSLNSGIGDLIRKIKSMTHLPVAVLTNGSLLWLPEVRDALLEADLVLPSLDAGDERMFRYVNRPHREITFDRMVTGLVEFVEHFSKPVWLEVLLLAGVTGTPSEVQKIAGLAKRIRPERIQLNTVSRPPAEEFASPVATEQMQLFKQLFSSVTEVISESGRDEACVSVRSEDEDASILALLSRRPCTVEGISIGLGMHAGDAIKRLEALSKDGAVKLVRKQGAIFYETVRRK